MNPASDPATDPAPDPAPNPAPNPAPGSQPSWRCTWRTGPDTGGTAVLPPGRHVVGRAPAVAVRCDDPLLEPHHVLLEVRHDGSLSASQLTGRVPARINDGRSLDGCTPFGTRVVIEMGASTLECEPERGAPVADHQSVRHDGTVVRRPRAVESWTPAALEPPSEPVERREPPGGLLPATLALAGAAVMAVVLHQVMFLTFGAIGGLVAVGSWVAQHLADRRRREQARRDHAVALDAYVLALAADRDRFVRVHLARTPTTASAMTAIAARRALWDRRPTHDDAWRVSLGQGAVEWRTDGVHPVHVPDLPVAVCLAPGRRIAVIGTSAATAVYAWLLQLAAATGPADVRVVVVTDQSAPWECLRGLPQLTLPDGTDAIIGHDELAAVMEQFAHGAPHLVLVADSEEELTTRTSALRRALGHAEVALIAVLPEGAGVPAICTAALTLTNGPMARWVSDTATTFLPEQVRVAGVAARTMRQHVALLAGLRDPEDTLGAGRLPTELAWEELVDVADADAVLQQWQLGGNDPAPRTRVGAAADGGVDIDLVRDGPHGLLAGTTGAGKSEFLRTLVAGLAVQSDPAHLQLVLVDYKGGAAFDALTRLPHVVGVVTDLDAQLADRALRSLHAELRRREQLLRDHGAADLTSLRAIAPDQPLARLVVVVDEFAALVAEQPEFLHALVGVAQRGRSLGVHLLLATQRPQGVISDDIRANTNLRIALRLHDEADALDVVGDRSPVTLPRRTPGRAVMRLGPEEHVLFQTARLTDPAALVTAVCDAAARARVAAGPSPWLPPLPATATRADLAARWPGVDALGTTDDPDHQRHLPLQWCPADGSVLVAGASRSGVTSTLQTLAHAALRDPAVHLYVFAPDRPALEPFAVHPACVAVQFHEHERLARALARLGRPATHGERRVIVIDRLDVLRRSLDAVDAPDEHDALEAVLHGVSDDVVLLGTASPGTLPAAVAARCSNRWVHHLLDAHDAAALGVPTAAVPGAVPGRIVVAGCGLQAQVAMPDPSPSPSRPHRPVAAVTVVPEHVDSSAMPAGAATADHVLLPIGIDARSGQPGVLPVPEGDHVLVLGGSRSGRSAALTRMAAAWREAYPTGKVVAVLPRRSSFQRSLADEVRRDLADVAASIRRDDEAAVLLVVDDAELVDDAMGDLATLVGSRRQGLMVLAAARGDALRQRYGHWTTAVRHSRLGMVAAGSSDTDGDLLGALLPRRLPLAPRPGLMWVVQDGEVRLLQLAIDTTVRAPLATGAQ